MNIISVPLFLSPYFGAHLGEIFVYVKIDYLRIVRLCPYISFVIWLHLMRSKSFRCCFCKFSVPLWVYEMLCLWGSYSRVVSLCSDFKRSRNVLFTVVIAVISVALSSSPFPFTWYGLITSWHAPFVGIDIAELGFLTPAPEASKRQWCPLTWNKLATLLVIFLEDLWFKTFLRRVISSVNRVLSPLTWAYSGLSVCQIIPVHFRTTNLVKKRQISIIC